MENRLSQAISVGLAERGVSYSLRQNEDQRVGSTSVQRSAGASDAIASHESDRLSDIHEKEEHLEEPKKEKKYIPTPVEVT